MARLARHVSRRIAPATRTRRSTPQSQPIYGREAEMVTNNAGGVTFEVDDFTQLRRFLILGSEGGTYYTNERKLTRENATCIERCANLDFERTLNMVLEVSEKGLAPKQGPTMFAYALLCSRKDPAESGWALEELPRICRIGTHLFEFMDSIKELRGRGRALNRALQNWYLAKDPAKLAYQITKYQQRGGWSHRDILRLCKPKTADPVIDALFGYIVGKPKLIPIGDAQKLIDAVERAKQATTPAQIVRLINEHNLVRECIPTQFLNDLGVWEALLQNMPAQAMIRNLGKMTSINLLTAGSSATATVVDKLCDVETLRRARVHPVGVLIAQKIYATGHGMKGSLTWRPVGQISNALDEAFSETFQLVTPAGTNHLLAIDVSGSMSSGIANTPLTCCEGAAAMAMVTARTEPITHTVGFASGGWTAPAGHENYWGNGGMKDLGITADMRMDQVLRATRGHNFGGTDCALPMVYAKERGLDVNTFVLYTDNETWAGRKQPVEALREYRQYIGHDAKLVVVGMASNEFTIADPKDQGMMDVVGFDASAPKVIADFARGDI